MSNNINIFVIIIIIIYSLTVIVNIYFSLVYNSNICLSDVIRVSLVEWSICFSLYFLCISSV